MTYMTMRVAARAALERSEELVEPQKIGMVELGHPPKWISRASETPQIGKGNHGNSGVAGDLEDAEGIVLLHAPLRSRASRAAKAEKGRRVLEAGFQPGHSWRLRRFFGLQDEGALERVGGE
jgi:hypothetical protein